MSESKAGLIARFGGAVQATATGVEISNESVLA